MKQMNSHDLEDVMIIIVRRIQKGNIESYFYALLFKEFVDYRREIVDGILEDDSKIGPTQMASLKTMYVADKSIIEELLDKLLSHKRITQTIVDKIKDVKK